jgi:hypothetical protein
VLGFEEDSAFRVRGSLPECKRVWIHCRLAVKAKRLNRKVLAQVATIVTPETLLAREFLATLATVGIKSVKLPPQSPNLNAYAERFVRTIREDCLKQMIFFGEDALRNAIREFVTHYHLERNH